MKTELLQTIRNEVFVSSKVVSDSLGVEHRDLVRTIKTLLPKIDKKYCAPVRSTFPKKAAFKFIKSTQINKQKREYDVYIMNETACLLLAMQLSSSPKAFQVQQSISIAFTLMKNQLLAQQNNSWIDARKKGEEIRVEETDAIKEFVDYATKQGSTSAKLYYMNITKMTNKALELIVSANGKPIKELASINELGFISVIENRVCDLLYDGMDNELPHKFIYKQCRDEIVKFADSLVFKPMISQ